MADISISQHIGGPESYGDDGRRRLSMVLQWRESTKAQGPSSYISLSYTVAWNVVDARGPCFVLGG